MKFSSTIVCGCLGFFASPDPYVVCSGVMFNSLFFGPALYLKDCISKLISIFMSCFHVLEGCLTTKWYHEYSDLCKFVV